MSRTFLLAALVALPVMTAGHVVSAQGQSAPPSQQIATSLPELKKSILAATGYDGKSVDVTAGRFQLVVTVVNSKLAGAAARDREGEAQQIAAAIAKAMAGKAQFKNIQALHVDYVTRASNGSDPQLVDAIDFRRDPQGNFQHHVT